MNEHNQMSESNVVRLMPEAQPARKGYRFDIFKAVEESGKLRKVRSVGFAYLPEGAKTYTVYLKTFLKDQFCLLPEEKGLTDGDYVILTREPSRNPGRKYRWHNVGTCKILTGEMSGYMKMNFDLLSSDGIFMSLHPMSRDPEVVRESVAA